MRNLYQICTLVLPALSLLCDVNPYFNLWIMLRSINSFNDYGDVGWVRVKGDLSISSEKRLRNTQKHNFS